MTIAGEACGSSVNRPIISKTPGVYSFGLSVPATAPPGGGSVCRVNFKVFRDGVVVDQYTLLGGESASSIVTVPTPPPGTAPGSVYVEVTCLATSNSTCHYSLTASRQ